MGYYQQMESYNEQRAAEDDDAYLGGRRLRGPRARPRRAAGPRTCHLRSPPARMLDVGCGTGFLTCHLKGEVVGLDQSEAILKIARGRVPRGVFVRGDVLDLPFPDESSIGSSPPTSTGSFSGRRGRGSCGR
jgi:SAM-dependent methyltransferase